MTNESQLMVLNESHLVLLLCFLMSQNCDSIDVKGLKKDNATLHPPSYFEMNLPNPITILTQSYN